MPGFTAVTLIMATPLSPLIAILVVLATVGLIWLSRARNARAILQARFRTSHAPVSPLIPCDVRFPLDELSTPCVAHASPAGLYLVTPPDQIAKWHWGRNTPFLKQPVLIPWTQLHYYPAKFPMRNWLRLDIRSTQATFFIRENVAVELLRAAGQPVPASTL